MAISGDYAQPVQVNGFTCRNCTDVDNAKKHIDPAHPKSGPYDVNAATDTSRHGEAVKLSGALSALGAASGPNAAGAQAAADPTRTGTRLDLSA